MLAAAAKPTHAMRVTHPPTRFHSQVSTAVFWFSSKRQREREWGKHYVLLTSSKGAQLTQWSPGVAASTLSVNGCTVLLRVCVQCGVGECSTYASKQMG